VLAKNLGLPTGLLGINRSLQSVRVRHKPADLAAYTMTTRPASVARPARWTAEPAVRELGTRYPGYVVADSPFIVTDTASKLQRLFQLGPLGLCAG